MDSTTRQRQIFIEQLGHLTLEYGVDQESPDTNFLGTQLLLISMGLGTVNPKALVNGDIPELNKVIAKLESIAEITDTSYFSTSKAHTDRLRNNLAEYFKSLDHSECQELSKTCEGLVKALRRNERVEHILANPPKSGKIEYPMSVKRKLLSGLRNDSICASCVGLDESQGSPRWHPTRLLLQQKPREDNCDTIDFNVVVARIPQECWKDVGLSVPLREDSVELSAGNDSCNSPNHGQESDLGQGVFCPILRDNVSARSRFVFHNGHFSRLPNVQALEQQPCPGSGITLTTVLQQYTLEIKDKFKLAHTIAQALWQFYDTELLDRKWDSDCILFMPEEDEGFRRALMKPYVSIQFEASEENIGEYLPEKPLVHRYPRILAFAIMLVEIGLGIPLQLQQCNSLVAQANTDFDVALRGLHKLKRTWKDSSTKDVFKTVIENCLISYNYGLVDTTDAAVPSPAGNQDGRTPLQIDNTRKVFYNKVVWPLQWLADVGVSGD